MVNILLLMNLYIIHLFRHHLVRNSFNIARPHHSPHHCQTSSFGDPLPLPDLTDPLLRGAVKSCPAIEPLGVVLAERERRS